MSDPEPDIVPQVGDPCPRCRRPLQPIDAGGNDLTAPGCNCDPEPVIVPRQVVAYVPVPADFLDDLKPYRTGRKVGNTIYRHGRFIGSAVTPDEARRLVDAANRGAGR